MSGLLSLVGVGPGDPELLTLKAVRVLRAANVVAYPSTGEDSALAFEIARGHIGADALLLPVPIPMTIERGPAQAAYDAAADVLLGHIDYGRNVAWLCEGDPLFYGSAMYLRDPAGRKGDCRDRSRRDVADRSSSARLRRGPQRKTLKVLPAPLPDAELARTRRRAVGRNHQGGQALRPHPQAARRDRACRGRGGSGACDDGAATDHAAQGLARTSERPYFRRSFPIAAMRTGREASDRYLWRQWRRARGKIAAIVDGEVIACGSKRPMRRLRCRPCSATGGRSSASVLPGS